MVGKHSDVKLQIMGEIMVKSDSSHYKWIMEPGKQAFLDHGEKNVLPVAHLLWGKLRG